MFEPINFEDMNESDVREEILAPLVNALGYRSGAEHNVIREQSLRYPRIFLGRKDSKKDPILRGKADYILVAGGKVRWVLEAKAPDTDIGADEIEQAWTYANHPEVRAVYFAICNGRLFIVFQTNLGPDAKPLFHASYEQMGQQDRYEIVKNLLGPEAILRDNPEHKLDIGLPIGPGLRSVARITNGLIRYEHNSLNLTVLNELQMSIAEGAVERDEAGHLVAYLRTTGPSKSLQEFNERLGLSTFEMVSSNGSLSVDQNNPTAFNYDKYILLPAGEELLDLTTWRQVKLSSNILCHVTSKASGVLLERQFRGSFSSELTYVEQQARIDISGSFCMHLA